MQSNETNIFARDDTMFGVCQALGEDFGFNPNYLRIALAVLVLWNPVAMLVAYVAAGALVFVSRLVAPNARRTATVAAQPAAERKVLVGDNEEEALAVAA